MRAVALALALTVGLGAPAHADFDVAAARTRALSREHRGIALLVTGLGMIVVGFAGAIVLEENASCFLCYGQAAGGGLTAGGATLALPLLAGGITLYRAGERDRRELDDGVAPERFVARAASRRRLGRAMAIAGGALTAAAIAFGGVALWAGYDHKPYDHDLWAAMTAVAAVHGAVGLGFGAGGLALWVAGREESR